MQHPSLSRILALGTIAGVLALPTAGRAQPAGAGRFPTGLPEARLIEKNAEKLGLDEETVAAVRKLADESRVRDEKRLAGTREARERLRALLDQELPDEAALLEQAAIISKAGAEAQKEHLQDTLRVRALLTPEQRAKLMEIRRQARQPRSGGRGPAGGR